MSYNNRNNYTHIQAFGTPSAFDPSSISKSNTPCSTASPYIVIDVNVSLKGTKNGDIIVLGAPLEIGSVVVSASIKSTVLNSVLGTTILDVVLYTSELKDPTTFPSNGVSNILVAPISGTTINNGYVSAAPSAPVPSINATPTSPTVPVGTKCPVYPVLSVLTVPTTSPFETGIVNVKLIVFSP